MAEGPLLLLTATAFEMRAVLGGAGLSCAPPETGDAVTRIRDVPVRCVVTGVGPLAAAHAAGRLAGEGILSPGGCRGLLLAGIAGTYAPERAPVGSLVLADREIWPEYGLRTEAGVCAESLGFPLAGEKGEPSAVWNALPLEPESAFAAMGLVPPRRAFAPETGLRFAVGPSVTVAGVSGTAAVAGRIAGPYAALSENMEGFPLALAAREAGVPFAELRAVSNAAGERSAGAWDIPAALAVLGRAVAAVFGP